jgi:drug/metabolite transporter (DMT)-like permease
MWALQFTCIKLVQNQVGPLFTVWGPMTLATIMLYPLIRFEPGEEVERRQDKRRWLTYLALAGFGVVPGQVLMTWGTRASLASDAAILNLTLPILTAFFAFLFLGERMTGVRWISFCVAILGVLLCSGIDLKSLNFGKTYLFGNVLILGATFGSAFYNSYGKKMLEVDSPMRMLFYTYVATFILMTPIVLFEEHDTFSRIPTFSARTWTGLFLLTVFHNYLSMVLFLKALKHLDAMQAALSNYLITFFGVPIAAIWLGERLTPATITGGILVLTSTLLITLWQDRKAATAA